MYTLTFSLERKWLVESPSQFQSLYLIACEQGKSMQYLTGGGISVYYQYEGEYSIKIFLVLLPSEDVFYSVKWIASYVACQKLAVLLITGAKHRDMHPCDEHIKWEKMDDTSVMHVLAMCSNCPVPGQLSCLHSTTPCLHSNCYHDGGWWVMHLISPWRCLWSPM